MRKRGMAERSPSFLCIGSGPDNVDRRMGTCAPPAGRFTELLALVGAMGRAHVLMRRSRWLCRLTEDGHKILAKEREDWARMSNAINLVLGTA